MKTSSLRIAVLVAIIAPFLVFHPTIARAATVTVMVGPGGFFFKPSSVTIHTGDSVLWMWSSGGHSSTSGSPGMSNGLWDSGILNQGATFMHTFNTLVVLVLLHSAWGMLWYGRHSRRDVESDADTNSPSPAARRRYGYNSRL